VFANGHQRAKAFGKYGFVTACIHLKPPRCLEPKASKAFAGGDSQNLR
jgi:hypothetical protein